MPWSRTPSWRARSGPEPCSFARWWLPTPRSPTVSTPATPASPSPSTDPVVPGMDETSDGTPRDDVAAPPDVPAPDIGAGGRESRTGGVLVIGGAGFVGSHLVDRLIAEGR